MRTSRAAGTALAALLVLTTAAGAQAFCRTTTCSPDDPNNPCTMASDGCLTGGKPLYWAQACVSFSVQKDGSPLRNISADAADKVISDGFSAWVSADCGSGHPSVQIYDHGQVSCDKQEYNQKSGNANIFMFRDGGWPYAPDTSGGATTSAETLALTTITYNVKTGEIYDADVEINSHDNNITVGNTNVAADLQSIVTHESGHFLGLAHSPQPDATMFASYQFGDTSLRSLSQDDIDGICTIYPPDRTLGKCDPTPRHGYSSQCAPPPSSGGCRASRPGSAGGPWNSGALAGALVALGLLARRRRSDQRCA